MAQRPDSYLTSEANIIQNETTSGANTALRVGTMLNDMIDSKINNDERSNDATLGGTGSSSTVLPSQNAVKTYVDGLAVGLLRDQGNYDASGNVFPSSGGSGSGGIVMQGDLWYISVDGNLGGTDVFVGYSVRALTNTPGQTAGNWAIINVGLGYVPENVINKSIDTAMGGVTPSDTLYPSQKAAKVYIDTAISTSIPSYPLENANNKSQDITLAPASTVEYPSNKAVVDYVAAQITVPTLQDVVTANPTATVPFGSSGTTGTSITASSSSDPSAASIEAYTGAGGYVIITNENGNASEIRATNLTTFRTHQLPNASGTLALTSDIITPTLQNVLTSGHSLINDVNTQGTSAGFGNTGVYVNAFGNYAADINTANNVNAFGSSSATANTKNDINALGSASAYQNTGDNVNALGNSAAFQNTGNNVNALGFLAANGNSGNEVNAIGYAAGTSNIYNYVNLFGENATANDNNQTVFASKNGFSATNYARLSYKNITADRKWELPNESGTIALESYKSYVVNLDWDGATWSTTNIYQNTLGGAVTLSNLGGSRMKLTTSGLFTSGKTVVMPSIIAQGQATLIGTLDPSFSTLPNDLVIRWNNASGANTTPASFASNAVYILEIRVYP